MNQLDPQWLQQMLSQMPQQNLGMQQMSAGMQAPAPQPGALEQGGPMDLSSIMEGMKNPAQNNGGFGSITEDGQGPVEEKQTLWDILDKLSNGEKSAHTMRAKQDNMKAKGTAGMVNSLTGLNAASKSAAGKGYERKKPAYQNKYVQGLMGG
jgi:hypothetical protein